MGIMGWSSTSMAARYQHITDPVCRDIAKRVGGLLWKPADEPWKGGSEGLGRSALRTTPVTRNEIGDG